MASIFSKKISRRVLRFLFWYSASAKVSWLMIRLTGLKNGRCGYYRNKWGSCSEVPIYVSNPFKITNLFYPLDPEQSSQVSSRGKYQVQQVCDFTFFYSLPKFGEKDSSFVIA